MCRRFALFFYAAIAVVSAHAAMAGEINGFESGKICRGGVIDREQLIIHHGTVRAFKIAKLSNVRREWEEEIIKEGRLDDFLTHYDRSLFTIQRKSECARAGDINSQEFLREEGCVIAQCRRSAAAGPVGPASTGADKSGVTKATFALRGKPEDLRKALTAPTTSAATFSGKQDFAQGNWTANAKLATGVVIETFLTETGPKDDPQLFNSFVVVPFVTYERRFSTAPKSQQVNKLGGGLYLDGYIQTDDIGHIIGVKTQFISDDEGGSSVVDGEVLYFPSLPVPYLGFLQPIGFDPRLSMMFEPTARFEYGHVFEAGQNAKLADVKEYARLGGEVTFVLTGTPSDADTLFDPFKFTASYKWLHGFSGPIETFQRFETGIDYTFGDQKNYGVGVKYINGHTDTTLQKDEFLEGTFTVKF